MTTLLFRVVSDPVAKARPRASFNGGKARIYTPTKTRDAEWRIRSAFAAMFPDHEPWLGPVQLTVTAFLRMPASIPKKRRLDAMPTSRPDCDNYLKTVLDALNGVAFRDDSQVVSVRCAKKYALEGPPAWNIELSEISDGNAPPHIPATEGAALDEKGATTSVRPASSSPA